MGKVTTLAVVDFSHSKNFILFLFYCLLIIAYLFEIGLLKKLKIIKNQNFLFILIK